MRNTAAGLIAALLLSVSAQAEPTCRLTFSKGDLRFDTCIQGDNEGTLPVFTRLRLWCSGNFLLGFSVWEGTGRPGLSPLESICDGS